MSMLAVLPGTIYAYRGKLPLEVECPHLCPGGCGRRLETLRHGPCAVCRGAWPETEPGPGPGYRSDVAWLRERCTDCWGVKGGRRCKRVCG